MPGSSHCGTAEMNPMIRDAAQIPCCCGYGIGRQLSLQFDLQPGNSHMPQCRKKREKKIMPQVVKTHQLVTMGNWVYSTHWKCCRDLLQESLLNKSSLIDGNMSHSLKNADWEFKKKKVETTNFTKSYSNEKPIVIFTFLSKYPPKLHTPELTVTFMLVITYHYQLP